ncbi:glycosyltransferase family 4 protein [Selenihalanaerobacter shriftii]|uniref:UDP-GlcNAc:undecaprenyl-phosphate GlcNAc-1-phosphate transferase n=1 Tax=Selenihalanaerobacter shriftii TaxID=142842 RepID=A0A1T4L0F1_9FIRM|nr:MraY family glycosyltransferase [Selenihalanaerobacter shriftii]SJZ48212.1 UDP-GlcNAc:undecaprenyl-phosphate GlcNAc-1-phosphate transferase [Selenihalanaerobacter shriftii]
MLKYIVAFAIASLITYVSTPIVKKLAFLIGAVDEPNARRINKHPIPSLGGIAIYVGFVLSVMLLLEHDIKLVGIIASSTLILIVGLVDDIKGISPKSKFIWQIMAAIVLTSFGIKIQFITNPFGGILYLGKLSIPFTVLWLVAITNTVNLIDGLDGLAAGVSSIAALTLFAVAMQESEFIVMALAIAIAGACLGFLQHNFNPAQIFMGDTGSLFLGFLLATISVIGSLKGAAAMTLIIPILALGVPIFDTMFAIIRRHQKGKPIFKADKGHIHHRLLEFGLNHKQAVIVVYLVSISLGMVAIAINSASELQALLLLITIVVILLYGSYKLDIINLNSTNKNYENIS